MFIGFAYISALLVPTFVGTELPDTASKACSA